jgi:hypothetical protein
VLAHRLAQLTARADDDGGDLERLVHARGSRRRCCVERSD